MTYFNYLERLIMGMKLIFVIFICIIIIGCNSLHDVEKELRKGGFTLWYPAESGIEPGQIWITDGTNKIIQQRRPDLLPIFGPNTAQFKTLEKNVDAKVSLDLKFNQNILGNATELATFLKMGTVKEIQIFNTILNSPDNVRIIIPNGQVTGSNIMNYTVNGTRRVDLVVGVSYDDDLKKAKQVIENVILSDERILKEPAYTIAVSELGESSVNFVVRPWVNAADYWAVRFDITEKIKLALDKNDITIPYPQRDVHMKSGVA